MVAQVVLAVSVVLTAYILVGYPLLLAVFPFRPGPPIRKDLRLRATVSVVLAVRDGGEFIRRKLESILAMDYPRESMEVLVVSDGSTDDTEGIVEEFAGRGVRLLRTPPRGKANALNVALENATGEIVFFTDVRQELHRSALAHLVANFADTTVGAVAGEMRLHTPEAGEQADMDMYWRYEIWVRARHCRLDSLFNTTGCIYAMRRMLAAPLPVDTLSDDAVLPLGAFFRGYRVVFDPQALAFDAPAVAGSEFRRRWRNLAGLWQVHVRIKSLFSRKNRMRFHFLSHKSSRLALPWALLASAGATLALPSSPERLALLTGGAVFVLLVLLDPFVPGVSIFKRVSSPARTFFVLNAASLAAIAVFVIPPQKLWKPTRVVRKAVTPEQEV
jgi:biofilm PGA synthesis N-glycosyltransferase PgaC